MITVFLAKLQLVLVIAILVVILIKLIKYE